MPGKRVREVYVELVGDMKLLVGGKNGYVRVRGGQGPNKNQYQGYTVDKKHSTAGFDTPRKAAIAPWLLRHSNVISQLASTRQRRKLAKVSAHARLNPGLPIGPTIPLLHQCLSPRILTISFPRCVLAESTNSIVDSTPKVPNVPADYHSAAFCTALPLHRRTSGTALEPIDYNINILSPQLHNGLLQAVQPRSLTPAQAALAHALGSVCGRAFPMHS